MNKILLLGAMKIEIEGLAERFACGKPRKIGAFWVREGVAGKYKILCCECGVGKVNSASAASAILCDQKDIDLVINLGVAGGVGNGLRQGDVVVGTRCVQHDYDQQADGLQKGQVNGFDGVYFECDAQAVERMAKVLAALGLRHASGVIASGDQFICSKQKAQSIRDGFSALACDMESAAIAQVCALYGVRYLAMRAISDGGDDGAVRSFYEFVTTAAEASARAVAAFLEQ